MGTAKATVKRLLKRFNFQLRGEHFGRTFKVPVVHGMGLGLALKRTETLDPVLTALLARKNAGAFIDVGVNIGQTLLRVKAANPDAVYHGFEPNLRCCYYVNELIRLNQLTQCRVYPVGLAEKLKAVEFFSDGGVAQGGSLVDGFRQRTHYQASEMVLAMDGDAMLAAVGVRDVGVLKVDVEGGELEVFQGLTQTLARARPPVLCEVLPVGDAAAETGKFRLARQTALEGILRAAKLAIYRCLPDGTTARLESFGIHADLALTNYLFVPEERKAEFAALGAIKG